MMPRPKNQSTKRTKLQARAIEAEEGKIIISRGTLAAQAKRREQVWAYMQRGVPKTVMAELLQVSRVTIYHDICAIRERAGRAMGAIKGNVDNTNAEVGVITGKLDAIADSALANVLLTESHPAKIRYMDTAVKAHWIRARILMETGILPRAGEEIKVTQTTDITFTQKFGEDSPLSALDNPESRRKVLAAVESMMRETELMLTVDATSKPVTPPPS